MIKKSLKKRFFAVLMCLVMIASCIIPGSLTVAAATDPEYVPSGYGWGQSFNIFSVALLDAMKVNGVNVYPTYQIGEDLGQIKYFTTYPDKTVSVTCQSTIATILTANGKDPSDFTGNVLSVSDSHIAVVYDGTLYTASDGRIVLPSNAALLDAKIRFVNMPDGYVWQYPFIAFGDVVGTLDFNTWSMSGYSSLPGYREVMPAGIPLSEAVNILSYDLFTSGAMGGSFSSFECGAFGRFLVSCADPNQIDFSITVSDLLSAAGISSYGNEPILSYNGFGDGVRFSYIDSHGYERYISSGRGSVIFDSFDQMLSTTLKFYWPSFYDVMSFPYLCLGYVWHEDSNGVPLALNSDTWPVFSDIADVPGYAALKYVPVTAADNLISYDFLEAGLGTYGQLSMPSRGLFEFAVSDPSMWGKETTFQLGTFGELCRLAGVSVPSSEFKLSVTGFNGSNALGKYWFYLTDTDQNLPWAFTGAIRTQEPLLRSDSDLASWPLSWKLHVPSNGIISIKFPVISFGSLFFKDADGAYVGLDADTWPDFSDINDVPTNPDYSQGYQDGYNAGLAAGSANGSYDEGYNAGLSVGHTQGYQEGYSAGELAGYDRGYLAGYEAGAAGSGSGDEDDGSYQDGFLDGYASGREQGYSEGFAAGKKAGYDEGYGDGKADGYDQGFQDGSGLISGATFDPMSLWESIYVEVRYHIETLSGQYVYRLGWEVFNNPIDVDYYALINERGEISTEGVVSWILEDVAPNYDGEDSLEPRYVEYFFTRITLKQPISTNLYTYSYSFTVNSEYLDRTKGTKISFLDQNNNLVANRWNRIVTGENNEKFNISEIGATKYISIVTGTDGDYYDTGLNKGIVFDISTSENSVIYNNGYTDGYTIGNREGHENGYTDGRDQGYKSGFAAGKIEGLQISESGDWQHLMAAVVDTPFNALRSLFSFNILGLDMQVAFGSMLSLCVLLFLLKKVLF